MLDLLRKYLKSDKYISLEITPSHGVATQNIIDKIETSNIINKISSFITTDSPLARLKSSSVVTAFKLQNHFQKPTIATLSMRDRNKIALQSELLGANELNIRTILALTGDGAGASDQPNVKGVFESNSLLLLDIVKCFNSNIDYSGKPFKMPPNEIGAFVVSGTKTKNSRALERKLFQKLKYNPLGVITQPIYSKESALSLIEIVKNIKASLSNQCESELILGFFPVTRLRTAQFLNSHVPGIFIPELWIEKLIKAKKISEDEELKVGIELSKQTLKMLLKIHPKIHLMGANNFELLNELMD